MADDSGEDMTSAANLPEEGNVPALDLRPDMRLDYPQSREAPAVEPVREATRETPHDPREPVRDIARDPLPRETPRDPNHEPAFRQPVREPVRPIPAPPRDATYREPRYTPPPAPAASPVVNFPQRLTLRSPWLIGLTFVIAIVGVAGAALLGWQLFLLQGQMKALQTSVSQSGQVADAASRLSDAATQANEIANQALATTTRPWIGVDTVEVGPIQPSQPLNIEVRVRNSGRTPSTDVQGLFLVYISPIDNPPALLTDPCTSCVRSVLLPNGVVSYRLSVRESVMTPDGVQRIKDGKDTMWIVGRLDYHDGEGEFHTTKSCLFYRSTGIASFTACGEGNSAN